MAKRLVKTFKDQIKQLDEHRDKLFIVGIDPGKTGAISVIDAIDTRCYMMLKMPTYNKDIDFPAIRDGLKHLRPRISFSAVENIHPRPSFGLGAASQGRFLKQAGILEGILIGLGIKTVLYTPIAWKKTYGLIIAKAEAQALGLTPNQKTKMLKDRAKEKAHGVLKVWGCDEAFLKINDGQAEAFLIAVLAKTQGEEKNDTEGCNN